MTTPANNTPTRLWITKEKAAALEVELKELEEVKLPAVNLRRREAQAEGDLKENAGFHAASEEKGRIEARIHTIKEHLNNSEIGDAANLDLSFAGQGTVVTVLMGERQRKFSFGAGTQAPDEVSEISTSSPIGQAIFGKAVGDKVSYEAPTGKSIEVSIVSIEALY